MKLIGKIFAFPLIVANWVFSLLLVFSSFGSMAAPIGRWPFAALSGMAFPILLLIELLFLILWLLVWKKGALISFFTLIICIFPILRYSPLNLSKSDEKANLTIMTFNVESFGYKKNGNRTASNPVLEYAMSNGAQVILFQEARTDVINSLHSKDYPYKVVDSKSSQACISQYPIISHEIIEFNGATGNSCLYLRILVDNDTLAVYNCHLQSNKLGRDDFDEYHRFMASRSDSTLYAGSKKVLKKLLNSTGLRAVQAELVAEKAKNETAKYAIVGGDFNDTPLSYSFHVFDRFMTDVYGKAGRGPGITYHEHRLYFRIDHMFCNDGLTPLRSWVDRSCKESDHYPVISQFKLNK